MTLNNNLSEEYTSKNYVVSLITRYINHYRGVPLNSWQRIFLTFINDMATGVTFFLSLFFVETLHLNAAKAGLIISCYGVGKTFGGMIGGKLTDKTSPDKVIVSCLLIEALIFIAFIYIYAFPALLALGFILGMCVYAFTTANKVCVLKSIQGHENLKLKIISIFYAASNLGLGVSAIYVGWLARYGFDYIFVSSSIFLFFSALFVFYLSNKNSNVNYNSLPSSQNKKEPYSVNNIQQNPLIAWLVIGCLFCIGLIIAQLGATYSLFIINKFPELGVNAVSIVFTLNSFLILFLQTPVVDYFNNNNKILMVGIGAFLMASGMALLAGAFLFPIVILSMIIYTIGEMIFFSMAQLVIYQHSSEHKKGQSLGLFQTTLALSVIIGPVLGGYVYDNYGGQLLWYCCGIIGVFWLIVSLYYKEHDIIEKN